MNPAAVLQLAAGTGTIVGFTWVVFRFIRWAVEFSCERLDARDARVSEREADVDEKMERWRQAMERDFKALKIKVGHYEQATNLLVGELHRTDPSNATLSMVELILRPYRLVNEVGPDPDEDLLRKMA